MKLPGSARQRIAVMVIAAALLAGTTIALRVTTFDASSVPLSSSDGGATPAPALQSPLSSVLPVPAALVDSSVALPAGPVAVPLRLQIPSINVDIPVLGVGITPRRVMDAPEGPAGDPVWQQAFWYRGSAVPGASSTALIAGHVDDPLGRPGAFANLDQLHPGDLVVVKDTRSGLDVRFSVTATQTYSLAQTTQPAVLSEIYGAGPVADAGPIPSTDGLAHLTLITCAGTFVNGTHDHRIVAYATRIS